MALNLVNYDASGSDTEEEMDQTHQVIVINKPHSTSVEHIQEDVNDIPKPSEEELRLAEVARKEKENLKKSEMFTATSKKNGRIMIGIPALTELEEDTTEKKIRKPGIVTQQGQSKLFSKLPPPKNSRHEPFSVEATKTDKPQIPRKSNPLIPQSVARKQVAKDSDDEDITDNFFTMDEPALKPLTEPLQIGLVHNPSPSSLDFRQNVVYTDMPTNQDYNMAGLSEVETETHTGLELDDIALQALQGTSGVKRKLPDDAQIIDIQGERLTYDPNMSYLKGISEEKSVARGPDITYNKLQKKKHQITYLAAQAKAREVDLKNQWAQNKSTRRQTQAKYGF